MDIKILRELNNLRGSGFAFRSVTTVTTCCLHVLSVLRASAKFFAAFRGDSTVLSPSTLALGSDGRKVWKVRKRSSGTFRAPFCIAMEVTFSGNTELINSALIVASSTGT